ncbi:unnamed protein product, partial [Tetraodon nigroviridis]
EGALPSLCLKQVYPKYAKQFSHLRLVERVAGLFIRFLGVKGNMRLGPTAFRTFIRYGARARRRRRRPFAFFKAGLHAWLQELQAEQQQLHHGGRGHPLHRHHPPLVWRRRQGSRYGPAGLRGGLLLPGGSQVQVPGAAGASGGAAGAVRGPAGGAGRQRGQALAELQPRAAQAQEPGAGRRQRPAAVAGAPEEGGEPGLPAAAEAQAPPTQAQRGTLRWARAPATRRR